MTPARRTARPLLVVVAAWVAAGPAGAQTLPPLPPIPSVQTVPTFGGPPAGPALPALPAVPPLPVLVDSPPDAPPPPADLPVARPAVLRKDDAKKPADDEPKKDGDGKPEDGDKKDDEDKKENGEGNGKKDEAAAAFAARHAPVGVPLSLGECIGIALDRQAALKAARHSLAATEAGARSLHNLSGLAERLSPDLPYRRQQAARGIAVAQAEVQKVRGEIVYDVTRLYWSYVYARQQEQTATDVIEQMETFYNVAVEIINSGVRDPKMKLNQFTLYGLADNIVDVKKLRVTAIAGRASALAALKEAMGVGDMAFYPRDTELPVMGGATTRDEVVAFAMSRRPELTQAAAGVDAFRLEVCAQAQVRFRQQVPTLASGSDLHSRQVPQADRGKDYSPGAIAPEMPASLVGKTEFRVARATELSLRQEAVYEKAVQLVRLEAETTYLAYDAATERLREAKKKYDNARKLVEESRAAAATRQDPELLVRNEALSGRAQAEYLEAVFEHLKALAALERVTAGGVTPAFPGR